MMLFFLEAAFTIFLQPAEQKKEFYRLLKNGPNNKDVMPKHHRFAEVRNLH